MTYREKDVDNALLTLFNSPTTLERRVIELTSRSTPSPRPASDGPVFTETQLRKLGAALDLFVETCLLVKQLNAWVHHPNCRESDLAELRRGLDTAKKTLAMLAPFIDDMRRFQAKGAQLRLAELELLDNIDDLLFGIEVEEVAHVS